MDIAQREYRQENINSDFELDEDFFCGSVGSISTLSESLNNNNFKRMSSIVQANWDQAEVLDSTSDLLDLKWHDYLDMSKKYTGGRSEPISITEKQY